MHQILDQYRRLDALEKMDNALLNLDKTSEGVGFRMKINVDSDFPYYHCRQPGELLNVLVFLVEEGFINAEDRLNPQNKLYIVTKGYERLRELKRRRIDSRQCFVAIWLASEMDEVYKKAIAPAIECIEAGQAESRFKALRIDNKEHTLSLIHI